ncbi:MAG: helix-turn-helix domain-containing protein [Syntrophomonadaceae bacterium]|nr:helix-turn-helix domain-containing protein [Syntrophomonadaceae bacterium]
MSKSNHEKIYPPWSRTESLPEMTAEAGVDFDDFIAAIKNDLSIEEMSEKFEVSQPTISQLKEHFYRYGISSVIGGD